MNICILTPRYPFPENGGDVLRINNIARYLKRQGHRITLLSFREATDVEPDTEQLYNRIVTVKRHKTIALINILRCMRRGLPIQCGYYCSSAFDKVLRDVVGKEHFDLFVSHLLRMVPYLEQNHLIDRSIVEMTDALSKTYAMVSGAKGGWLKKVVYRIERRLIQRYEQHVIHTFPKVVLVSNEDIKILTGDNYMPQVALHTNGVDIVEVPSKKYDANKICFVGNMRTLQNQDAVLYFVQNIFPKILEVCPDAMFYVVGAEPSRSIQALASEHVVVTGFVNDLNATICDACVVVAPVRVAAGIQNKVLVAMANRLPVVLTSRISTAIPELQDGNNCMIRDDEHSFAQACISLMQDEAQRDALAGAGYKMVSDHYSWQSKMKGFEKIE